MTERDKERLLDKVFYSPDGCWYWTGALSNKGYARIAFNGKNSLASRLSFRLFNGDIPGKLFVMHTCDNPMCVNPNHLVLGTQDDNMKDMVKKGRFQKPKPLCRRGHRVTIRISKEKGIPYRYCFKCYRINYRTKREKLGYYVERDKETD